MNFRWISKTFDKCIDRHTVRCKSRRHNDDKHNFQIETTKWNVAKQTEWHFFIDKQTNKQTNHPTNHLYIASPNSDSTTSATLICRTIISGWVLHVQIQLMNRRVHRVRAVVKAPMAVVVVVAASVEMHLWAVKWSIIQPIYHQLAC